MFERLELEAIHREHGMAILHQMMGQREAGRTESSNEYFVSGWRTRHRSVEIQRIPSRQKRIDLESPGQLEHIPKGPRFSAWYVDGRLLLKHTRLRTVIANAMTRCCAKRVLNHDQRESRHR